MRVHVLKQLLAASLCLALGAATAAQRSSTSTGASSTPSTQPTKVGGCGNTSNLAGSLGVNLGDQSTGIATNCSNFAEQQPIPCPDQGVSWGSGNICAGTAASTLHASSRNVVNTTTKYTGTATFQCLNGAYYISGTPTCSYVPDNCSSQTLSWGANGCNGTAQSTNHGSTRAVTNTQNNRAGNATFSCDDGVYTELPGSTCDKTNQPCSGQNVTWGGSCSGTTGNIAHSQSTTIPNTAANYTGSASFSCNNSNLTYSSGTCYAATCAATPVTWGPGCTANLPSSTHGTSTPANSGAPGYTGSATYSCFNGAYTLNSGSSCRAYTSCSSGSTSWGPGNYCGGSYPTLSHGQSQSFGNQRTGYTGDATATCTDGTISFSNTSCSGNPCISSRTTWSGGNCGGNVPTINSGTTTNVINDQSGYSGSASVRCEGAVLSANGTPTCTANPCSNQFLSWGGNCGANFSNVASGGSQSQNNVFTGYSGSASFQCFAGSWSFGSGSCSANPCSAQRGTWGSCGANVGALSNGQSTSIANDVAGYNGTSTFTCNAGSISASGSSCNENSCSSGTLSWGSGCSAPVGNGSAGAAGTLTNTAAGYSGSASFSCSRGTWAYQSGSCARNDNPCSAGTISWGGSCSAAYSQISHGATAPVTNSASGFTGAADLSCSNGAVSVSNSSCASQDTTADCIMAFADPQNSDGCYRNRCTVGDSTKAFCQSQQCRAQPGYELDTSRSFSQGCSRDNGIRYTNFYRPVSTGTLSLDGMAPSPGGYEAFREDGAGNSVVLSFSSNGSYSVTKGGSAGRLIRYEQLGTGNQRDISSETGTWITGSFNAADYDITIGTSTQGGNAPADVQNNAASARSLANGASVVVSVPATSAPSCGSTLSHYNSNINITIRNRNTGQQATRSFVMIAATFAEGTDC